MLNVKQGVEQKEAEARNMLMRHTSGLEFIACIDEMARRCEVMLELGEKIEDFYIDVLNDIIIKKMPTARADVRVYAVIIANITRYLYHYWAGGDGVLPILDAMVRVAKKEGFGNNGLDVFDLQKIIAEM